MDSRDFAANTRSMWQRINESRMVGYITVYDPDGENDDEELEVPFKYEACGLCNGKGYHVNPSIDSHGLSAEDFYDDPDFREDYFSGRYDIPCNSCHGVRVTPVLDEERAGPKLTNKIREHQESIYQDACERYREREMGY